MTTNDTTPDSSDDAEIRTRTRSRSRRSSSADPAPAETEVQTSEAGSAPPSDGGDQDTPVRRKTRSRKPKGEDTQAAPSSEGSAEATAAEPPATGEDESPAAVARRRRTRRPAGTASRTGDAEGSATPVADSGTETSGAEATGDEAASAGDDDAGESGPRRRRRGGRGRGRRGGRGRARTEDDTAAGDEPDSAVVDADAAASDDDRADAPPTRLQARGRSGRTTAPRSTGRGRARTPASSNRGGRRPLGGVSEETRRAINEGPPRRMLVTVGESRTQIAVLEDRSLVEHYVTRKEDVSYVGNIYLGRVQNVLPGMEAAFVDIGKGRNGVLYAGEVNYDEADLDGDLPRIEHTLKAGQPVLVQVTKDPMGTKGARLTQQLSVAGRYCVLAAGDGMLGISRKLTDEERERLRKILKGLRPEGFGLIVRTAAEGATREQLEADIARLARIWEEINTRAADAKPLDSVYEEPHLVMRVIRDVFGTEYSELIVDSDELAGQIRDYLSDVSPDFVDKVKVHSGDDHIFDAYEVTNQIRRALEKKVWLKSGGYLIIEKTEAMWVIDVNTGKFVGERNLEETVLRNNLEAADEIARQLRLRDMGGIIVIDFVDMLVPANRDEVLKRFRRELARDKTKSRVMEISKLGLVQMTRKNVSQGLEESFTETCDACEGRGAKIVDHMLH